MDECEAFWGECKSLLKNVIVCLGATCCPASPLLISNSIKSEIECSVNTQLEVRHRDFKLPLILRQGHLGIWRLDKMKLAKFDNRIEAGGRFVRGRCALFKRLLSRAENLSQMRSSSHLQPKAKYNYWFHPGKTIFPTSKNCPRRECFRNISHFTVREGVKKKLWKSGQADRNCWPFWSAICNSFLTSCHIWGYFAIL